VQSNLKCWLVSLPLTPRLKLVGCHLGGIGWLNGFPPLPTLPRGDQGGVLLGAIVDNTRPPANHPPLYPPGLYRPVAPVVNASGKAPGPYKRFQTPFGGAIFFEVSTRTFSFCPSTGVKSSNPFPCRATLNFFSVLSLGWGVGGAVSSFPPLLPFY